MHSKIRFRRANHSDFQDVLNLSRQLADHIQAEKPLLSMTQFDERYLLPGAVMNLLLAIRSDRVVGMISWVLMHELYSAAARVYITDLAVDATARGQGVGSALMNEVMAWARTKDVNTLSWDVWRFNTSAKIFYENIGANLDEEALPYVLSVGRA